jgi:hypothetical protein
MACNRFGDSGVPIVNWPCQIRKELSVPQRSLAWLSVSKLEGADPLEMNLLVAKRIPCLANLDVSRYQLLADDWASKIRKALPMAEIEFRKTPNDWRNDIHFFRLGFLCWFIDEALGIRYREDQKGLDQVFYTDPSDLFLHGVMYTRHGTCANMPTLHVALAWRLGWPVSLACAWAHLISRYEDGKNVYNIEATNSGRGGFHSHPDEYYQRKYCLSKEAIRTGSDLSCVTPKQMLGLFIGFRARYWADTGHLDLASADYLQARALFPENRYLLQKAQEVILWN